MVPQNSNWVLSQSKQIVVKFFSNIWKMCDNFQRNYKTFSSKNDFDVISLHSGEANASSTHYLKWIVCYICSNVVLHHIGSVHVTLHPCMQAIWWVIWKRTIVKSQINATSVIIHSLEHKCLGRIWKRTVGKSKQM